MIINCEQLNKLNEVDLSVQASNNTSADYSNALNSGTTRDDLQKLKNTGGDPSAVVTGPNTTDNSPMIDVNVPAGSSVGNVMNEPSTSAAIKSGASVKVHGDGFPMEETTKYTKKQVERKRLAKIRENGRICTKKTLFEGIYDDVLDDEEKNKLIDYCKASDFFIYGNAGPEFGGWRHALINTRDDWRKEIIGEILSANSVSFSSEKDGEIARDLAGKGVNFENTDIVKIAGLPNVDDYYIVWERDDA